MIRCVCCGKEFAALRGQRKSRYNACTAERCRAEVQRRRDRYHARHPALKQKQEDITSLGGSGISPAFRSAAERLERWVPAQRYPAARYSPTRVFVVDDSVLR